MSEHTPGPWKFMENGLIAGNGESEVVGVFHADRKATKERKAANRALLLAAPELLEAATNLLSYLPESGDPFQDKLEAALVAAIAKAEGNA